VLVAAPQQRQLSSSTMPPASPYGVGSRRNSQASRAKKAMYSRVPAIPVVISSSHSWPVLPTCC
jgi:hypothetical protein